MANGVNINGEALRMARYRKGWTLRDAEDATAAVGTRIDHTKIFRYENEERRPWPSTLKTLADALEVTVDELVATPSAA